MGEPSQSGLSIAKLTATMVLIKFKLAPLTMPPPPAAEFPLTVLLTNSAVPNLF